jgi:hypothetical protein
MMRSPEKELQKAAAGAKQLDLSGMKLEQIPEAVRGMTHLDALALGMNSLSFLPDWIGELKSLRYLDLSGPGNPLSAIPDSLGNLTNLVSLDLSGGPQRPALSDSIGNLVNLSRIAGSPVTPFPSSQRPGWFRCCRTRDPSRSDLFWSVSWPFSFKAGSLRVAACPQGRGIRYIFPLAFVRIIETLLSATLHQPFLRVRVFKLARGCTV